MDSKCIKKSTSQQLETLVEYMEENPDFARGVPVFGSSKVCTENQWQELTLKINSLGPSMRSVVEWKKTWADLKSRTKKKIAENYKSMQQTGGGLYRVHYLTELEQSIDKTCFLPKAAAPSGMVFGLQPIVDKTNESIDCCFQSLIDSPPRGEKAVAVITPTRQHTKEGVNSQLHQLAHTTQLLNNTQNLQITQQGYITTQTNNNQIPHTTQQSHFTKHSNKQIPETTQQIHITQPQQKQRSQFLQKRLHDGTDDEMPGCSSAKKRATDQMALIRQQIRVSEEAICVGKDQANSTKILAEAAKSMEDAASRMAASAEVQADAAKRMADSAAVQADAAKRSADAAAVQADAAKRSADAAVAQNNIFANIASLIENFLKNK